MGEGRKRTEARVGSGTPCRPGGSPQAGGVSGWQSSWCNSSQDTAKWREQTENGSPGVTRRPQADLLRNADVRREQGKQMAEDWTTRTRRAQADLLRNPHVKRAEGKEVTEDWTQ